MAMKRKTRTSGKTSAPAPTVADVLVERGKTHGDFTDQAACSQDLKRIMEYYIQRLNAVQAEAVAMICVKLSRIATGDPNVKDHWVDIAGYATLVADRI